MIIALLRVVAECVVTDGRTDAQIHRRAENSPRRHTNNSRCCACVPPILRRMQAFLASGSEPTGTERVAQARLSLSSQAFQLLVAVSAPHLACDVVVTMHAMRLCRKKCANCCSVVL